MTDNGTAAESQNKFPAEVPVNGLIKQEEKEHYVKVEALDCLVCNNRCRESFDLYTTITDASGATLYHFLSKFNLNDDKHTSKSVCKLCLDLINVLEQTEIEYHKAREAFEAIISKNPLFIPSVQSVKLGTIKHEDNHLPKGVSGNDSDDEPLSRKKPPGKEGKRKKDAVTKHKKKKETKPKIRKKSTKESKKQGWLVEGSEEAQAAEQDGLNKDIKQEDFDGQYDNENEHIFEVDMNYDDDDSSFLCDADDALSPESPARPARRPGRPKGALQKKPKSLYPCDECDVKYTSMMRLDRHKLQAHSLGKPPYICEVCGAAYKHKRACDIHVRLHRGISDWKCEECNKLFPSKGALARHNNIHTGKLNYQCDLCGKSFIHTSSFKMHKLSHSGLKPHACSVCGLRLMTRSHLQRHLRIHSGEKRHACSVCGKRFGERYNLAAHMRSHESPASGEPASASASASAPAPPRRRLFRCTLCAERFERRYMLERHMSVVHLRALERPPPTPRNTMSKLLKQQALVRSQERAAGDSKEEPPSPAAEKITTNASSSSAWVAAFADFPRQNYSH